MSIKNCVYVVGIGPGDQKLLTPQAQSVLEQVDVVVGYTLYIDLVRNFCEGKEVIDTGMMKEVDRCTSAVEEANGGKSVAVVCSGDGSVYGMASLIYELVESTGYKVEVEVIPGITAALSVGAELGSPLTNDFSVISLSNLLTPQELIVKRITAAAGSDMATVLYNPKSKRRTELIKEVKEIFLRENSELLAGFVKSAGRKEKEVWIGKLRDIPLERVDMLTTVIIGNSQTDLILGKMVTRRGYHKKYGLK